METTPPDKECRSDLRVGFALVPRKTDPAPVLTRSSEVSRHVEPISAMVTRSRAREGRGISAIPETQLEPEVETRPEPEIPEPQVSMTITCERGLGAARPFTTDTASQ